MPNLFNAVTLSDYAKRMTPGGALDQSIVETLARSNPIMSKIKWIPGNLLTGIQTTQRTSIPEPGIRRINRGVEQGKSTTKQIIDTCCIFEQRSLVDTELLALYPQASREAFRKSEDLAFIEGFGVKVAKNLFYGDVSGVGGEETFNGISVRYPTIGGNMNVDNGYQVVSAGGTTAGKQTSAFLIGFGNQATAGVYPMNSTAGLTQRDLGEVEALDDEGRKFQAVSTLFNWKAGLTVRDPRANALVRNIDITKLSGMTSEEKFKVISSLIVAKNRIRNLQSGEIDYGYYVSRSMYDFIELYLFDKNNVHVTRQELAGKTPELYITGIPVLRCDEILETEAVY